MDSSRDEKDFGAQPSALAQPGQLSTAILASLPGTAVLVVDRELRVRHAAGQALERHGLVAEEMEGLTLEELATPDTREEVEPHLREALAGGVVRFDRPSGDGKAIYRSDVAPLRENGQIVAAVVVSRDVTEARASSAALAASERRYRMLADHASDLITRHGADSTCLYASPSARDLLGYDPKDVVGVRSLDFHHPEDAAFSRAIWGAVLESSEPRTAEYRLRRADGSYTWVESTLRRVVDDATGQIEVVVATRDVTERKCNEQIVRDAQERFEAAFRYAPIGKAIVALNGRCLKVNEALCELTGLPERELLGKSFQELTHPDDLDADATEVGKLVAGETRAYRVEKRLLRADGETIWGAVSGSLVRGDDGRPLHLIAQVQDIGEQRRHQDREREQLQRLRELDALKDEFIAFVSHELRTPLTSIRGYV